MRSSPDDPAHTRSDTPNRVSGTLTFELGWIMTDKGGIRHSDITPLNHALRRMLWNRGDYVRPIELVSQHLNTRG